MDLFGNWKPSNYILAGLGVEAARVAGQPGEPTEVVKRSINDITIPIFIDEAKRRNILTMKTKCKTNWLGNGFDKMVYELLFFALEDLKIFNDTGHVINGDYLFLLDKSRLKEIHKIHNSDFGNEYECYTMNERELYKFLFHYKNKAIENRDTKAKTLKTKLKSKSKIKSNTSKNKLKRQI